MMFKKYNLSELRCCGDDFANYFKHSPADLMSVDILRWFATTAPPDVRVYGRFVSDHEYLVDQCHTTFPKPIDNGRWHQRWVRALNQPLEFRLALESEWGSEGSHSENLARVLDDAWKAAVIRANVKVVIFATTSSKKALRIIDCLEKLRSQSRDPAPWLCIDIPWAQKRVTPRTIIAEILEDRLRRNGCGGRGRKPVTQDLR